MKTVSFFRLADTTPSTPFDGVEVRGGPAGGVVLDVFVPAREDHRAAAAPALPSLAAAEPR